MEGYKFCDMPEVCQDTLCSLGHVCDHINFLVMTVNVCVVV